MPTSPLCPLDGAALEPHAHGALAFHGCPRCHGLWFTAAAIDGTRHGAVPADPFVNLNFAAPEGHVARRVRHCPGCGGTLRARQVDGVEVDTCPGCRSVWLDAGELDTVVAWQRLRDRSVAGPAAATAVAATAVGVEAGAQRTAASQTRTGAETVADAALEVVAGDGWVAVEMICDLAGFLGGAVSGGAGVAVEAAGAVLSLVGGLFDGL